MERGPVIVGGASAGGYDLLQRLVAALPPDLPAALFVVWHLPPDVDGVLPEVLSRAGPLPAAHAVDGEAIVRGRVYVAPPDRHLEATALIQRLLQGGAAPAPTEAHSHQPAEEIIEGEFRVTEPAHHRVGTALPAAAPPSASDEPPIHARAGVSPAAPQPPLQAPPRGRAHGGRLLIPTSLDGTAKAQLHNSTAPQRSNALRGGVELWS